MKNNHSNGHANGRQNGKFAYLYGESNLKRVKKIITSILGSKAQNKNELQHLKLNKITAYECKGYDLNGSSAGTHDPRRHFLVNQCRYEVYEIPYDDNDPSDLRLTGNFVCLIRNIDHGKWYIADMKHRVKRGAIPCEQVTYHCIGEYEISADSRGDINWLCTCSGGYCVNGLRTSVFDTDHVRMEEGYHTSYNIFVKKYGNGSRRI